MSGRRFYVKIFGERTIRDKHLSNWPKSWPYRAFVGALAGVAGASAGGVVFSLSQQFFQLVVNLCPGASGVTLRREDVVGELTIAPPNILNELGLLIGSGLAVFGFEGFYNADCFEIAPRLFYRSAKSKLVSVGDSVVGR